MFISRSVARDISGKRPLTGEYRCVSERAMNSSRLCMVGGLERDWYRSQRERTGASTEMRMKNGRRSSVLRMDSV